MSSAATGWGLALDYRRWASWQGCLGVMRSYPYLRVPNALGPAHQQFPHFLTATLYTRLLGAGSQ